eukprot:jgi/Tetstr1/429439/TSEL_019349.t1
MWHMMQGAVIHYLRDCEECDAPSDSEECRRVDEYIKKQREEGFNCYLTFAQMCSMQLPDDMSKLNMYNLVVHEKPETRRHVVFKHKTWDVQWVPTDDEYGKQAILRDRRAEVEQHDNHVYVGEVLYLLPGGSDMSTCVKNASVDVPSIPCCQYDPKSTLSRSTTLRFPIAAPPYIERICYATSNYRARYPADNHIYAHETVLTAFREYTPSPFLPTPLRPSLWVVLTVHLVMYKKHGNVRHYLARHYFQDEGKGGQGGRKKGPSLPSADRVAKALDLAEEWHQSELGRYYQAG